MEILKDLETLEKDIAEIKKNFNNQMNAVEFDLKEFHKHLIELSSKYPDQKEILEFIVFINDRIETNQTNMKEVLSESLNEILEIKRTLVLQQIKEHKNILLKKEESFLNKIKKGLTDLKNIKSILTLIVILLAIGGYIIAPEQITEAVELFLKLPV